MYLRGIFIALFGMTLHFFYYSRLETSIDSFSAGKKITTPIPKIYDFPMEKREWTLRSSCGECTQYMNEIFSVGKYQAKAS